MSNSISFEEHMKNRVTMFDNCQKVTIGKDFAVFEFEDAFDLKKAFDFADKCNKMYKYTFESNQVDKFVCFNV